MWGSSAAPLRGIELSAQLHQATRLLSAYGLDKVKPSDIRIHVIEASGRLLPLLPEHLSRAIHAQLAKLGIQVHHDDRSIFGLSCKVLPSGPK